MRQNYLARYTNLGKYQLAFGKFAPYSRFMSKAQSPKREMDTLLPLRKGSALTGIKIAKRQRVIQQAQGRA